MKIEDLIRYGERMDLECKSAQGGLPKSLWESYSAFAKKKVQSQNLWD